MNNLKVVQKPYIGEERKARDAGKSWRNRYIWVACNVCGKERWVAKSQLVRHLRCKSCRMTGASSPRWLGGKVKNGHYIDVWIGKDDFFSQMANKNNYVGEHRLVMAKYLGRCLQFWEVVHHKNGIKADNRIENLELSMRGAHIASHGKGYQDGFAKGFEDGLLEVYKIWISFLH